MSAREDRAKRRRERRAESGAGDGIAAERAPRAELPKSASRADGTHAPLEESRGGGGFPQFVRESVGELRKVDWPGQSQVIQATTVVVIACVIVGIWLAVNDFVWERVVRDFLLK